MKKFWVTVLAVSLLAVSSIAMAQTWGIYSNLDGHVLVTRTVEGSYYRWTYTFWHGNENVPQDPVYRASVRFLTLDNGNASSTRIGSENYWDYKGRWQTGSGPGTNPGDYVWNNDWMPITGINEILTGSVHTGVWDIGNFNQGEYRMLEVSFLTDLPGVSRNYVDIFGDFGVSHAVIAEVPAVPEPSSLLAMVSGLGALGGLVLRRKA